MNDDTGGIVRRVFRGVGYIWILGTLSVLAFKFEPVREAVVNAFVLGVGIMIGFYFPKDHK